MAVRGNIRRREMFALATAVILSIMAGKVRRMSAFFMYRKTQYMRPEERET